MDTTVVQMNIPSGMAQYFKTGSPKRSFLGGIDSESGI